MSTEFTREDRYIVFKLSDVERYLTDADRAHLAMMKNEIDAGRDCANKPPFKGLIVEANWPEYEPTWQAIEARVTGAQPAPNIPEGCPPHAEIYVGDDMFVWCDWKDFDLVKKYNWNLTTRNRSGCLYAQSWDCHNTSERKRITMHGLIMPAPDGQFVDHINGNGLDNRRENLRLVTHQQNSFNQKHHGGSSKFKGVSIDRSSGSWRAYITVDGKRKHLGRHGTELDAAKAYDMAAKEFFGEYAKLNLESAPSPTTLDET